LYVDKASNIGECYEQNKNVMPIVLPEKSPFGGKNLMIIGQKFIDNDTRQKTGHAGEKFEDFETHFRIK
jgi:hypothetical protein